jgi:cytochrome c oxidase subunit III
MSSAISANARVDVGATEIESIQGYGGRPPGVRPAPLVSNARLAIVLFLGAETMLFAGLLGTFVVFRVGSLAWPPPKQPYLPIAVTWINTAILLASGWVMRQAVHALRADRVRELRSNLLAVLVMGSIFLVVQGYEWVRLIHHGLTLSSSTYGATFYTLIGLHGLHVLGAVLWLVVVSIGAMLGRYSAKRPIAVELCSLYWYYVCLIWIAVFGMVYLS